MTLSTVYTLPVNEIAYLVLSKVCKLTKIKATCINLFYEFTS